MAQAFLGLLNPQLGLGALIVSAFTFLLWRVHKDRSLMDPELARVRVMEKVINRAFPWWRRGKNTTVEDCVKVLDALVNSTQPDTAPEYERTGQPDAAADDAASDESVPPDDSDGP